MPVKNPIEAFHSIPEPRNPKASPEGDWVACQWNPTGRFELHVINVETGEQRQLTDGETARNPTWWTYWWLDDHSLVFQDHHNPPGEDWEHTTGIYRVDLDGTVEHRFNVEGGIRLWGVNRETGVIYYHLDGEGYWYDPATGERDSFASFQGRATGICRVHPDGDRIAFNVNRPGNHPYTIAAYLAQTDGSDPQPLTPADEPPFAVTDWHPDGDRLLVYRLPLDESEPHFGVYSLATEEVEWIAEDRPVVLLDGGIRVLSEGSDPKIYDLDGTCMPVAVDGDLLARSAWTVATGDTSCVLQRRPADRRPAELVHHDIDTGDVNVLFAPAYDTVTPADFVTGEEVAFESPGGSDVEGLLYYPPNDGNEPVPAVADLYARNYHSTSYRPEDQLLAHSGYAVFVPLSPADAYTEANHDVIAAAGKWLARQEGIDGQRVACYGQSQGGYNVYMQTVRYPDVWDAFIASTGIVDLLHEDSSLPPRARKALGDPDENAAAYHALSPIEHIDEDVGTPLLMLHGEHDAASEHPRMFGKALEAEGLTVEVAFEYVELPGQDHYPKDRDMQIRRWREVADFLDRRF